jgi:hypothetical protein
MALPILLTEENLIAWRAVDPSARADDLGTLASESILFLVNQASFNLDLPSELRFGLDMGHNYPAADVTIL